MSELPQNISYIGVDIAKSKFDICLYNGNYSSCAYYSYSNDLDGFFEFFSLLNSVNNLKDIRIGLEATSTYMIDLQKYMDNLKIRYILINPSRLHHYIKYKNYQSKTDKLDSYYIADYITTLKDTVFNSSHSETKTMYQSISAYLNFMTKSETHLKALQDSILKDEFTSLIMTKEIIKMKTTFAKSKNVALKELLQRVSLSMPEYDFIKADLVGVGDMTLLTVLPIIYDISDKYSISQLQSFIGLDPVYKDSGSSINKKQRISKTGNSEARKVLYMSALSSIQHNTLLKEKYERLLSKGKHKKVALIAISAHIFRAIVTKLNYYKNLNK